MPAGRPIEWTPEKLEELGKELIEHVSMAGVYTIESFCIQKEKSVSWLTKTAERHEEFSQTYARAHDILANKLIVKGITEGLDSWIAGSLIGIHSTLIKQKKQQERKEKLDDELTKIEHQERMKNKHEAEVVDQDRMNQMAIELQEYRRRHGPLNANSTAE